MRHPPDVNPYAMSMVPFNQRKLFWKRKYLASKHMGFTLIGLFLAYA